MRISGFVPDAYGFAPAATRARRRTYAGDGAMLKNAEEAAGPFTLSAAPRMFASGNGEKSRVAASSSLVGSAE
jgi:hypothetical protein